VLLDVHLSHGLENVRGVCAPRALGRAIVALVAQPDVRVIEQFVFEAPLSPNHLLPRIRPVVRRDAACYRAGGTLIALLQVTGSGSYEVLRELKIGFGYNVVCHG